MLEHTLKPMVTIDALKKNYFWNLRKKIGVTAVVENDKVVGIITDGDIRRMLNERDICWFDCKDIMTKNGTI
jgi:arabinose-5-phosphate isomerase